MMSGNNNDDIIPEKTRIMADIPPPPPPGSPLKAPTTPSMSRGGGGGMPGGTESSSTVLSTGTISAGGGVASPDPLLSPPLLLEIEEGTPAAEALKANADVRVSKLRKVGRSTRLQAGVRVLKSAARTASGQPGHAGDRRGAPAFVAPRGSGLQSKQVLTTSVSSTAGLPPPTIPEVDDEGDSDHGVISDAIEEGGVAGLSGGDNYSCASQEGGGPLDKSINLDDSSTDNTQQPLQHGTPSAAPCSIGESLSLAQHSFTRHGNQHITHAALPAAIAAACRAGEEMDRKRATQIEHTNSEGAMDTDTGSAAHHKSLLMTPLANLFKSTANISNAGDDIDDNASAPIKIMRPNRVHRRADSVPGPNNGLFSASFTSPRVNRRAESVPEPNNGMFSASFTVFRRTSMEYNHKMPSEISVAETEKHANLRDQDGDSHQLIEDLSDDGIEIIPTDIPGDVHIKKHVEVNPIVVEIPGERRGNRRVTIEETKDEEERRMNADEEDEFRPKAKKRISRRATKRIKQDNMDEDSFHFNGPKSVRKWVNKRRSKEQEQRSYVKGKVIDGKHELYAMSIAVMFGMRTSIGRTNLAMSRTAHNERRWLDNDDMMAVEKYEFPPRGSDTTPPHQLNHTFKFKDYSPLAFAYLRRMFGVNEYDFLCSVCGNANYIEFQSNAKSGQFFFYSPDGKYMIKTMTNTESKFLRRIMPHYFRHCAKNPNTLVTKFLGMYRVKLYHLRRNVKFVVMKSVYDTDKCLHNLFDVKGSSTGRDAKPNDAVKKDNDIRRTLPGGAFALTPDFRERLRTQVENDCTWLKAMKIMDYSMLIGVHNISHRTTKMPLKPVTQPPARACSNDDGDDRSNSSIDASNATLDRFLDVDDDDSYLDGAHAKGGKTKVAYDTSSTSDEAVRTVRAVKSPDNIDDESSKGSRLGTDALVEKAIEDMYWPFHRFYDIQGLRRMTPIRDSLIGPNTRKGNESAIEQKEENGTFLKAMFASTPSPASMTCGGRHNLPTFEQPLSHRKDGGLMMDTTGTDLPLKLIVPGAPHMAEYCDGKIFYMGIIDILQQFNIRKRLEARYRRLGGKGWEAASCVHPSIYADRFIRFFDEYTACAELTNEHASLVSDSASNKKLVKRKTM